MKVQVTRITKCGEFTYEVEENEVGKPFYLPVTNTVIPEINKRKRWSPAQWDIFWAELYVGARVVAMGLWLLFLLCALSFVIFKLWQTLAS